MVSSKPPTDSQLAPFEERGPMESWEERSRRYGEWMRLKEAENLRRYHEEHAKRAARYGRERFRSNLKVAFLLILAIAIASLVYPAILGWLLIGWRAL